MKKFMTFAFTAIAAAAFTTASAQYTIDQTGFGFASKNSVQAALGLNNAQLQAQAQALAGEFSYVSELVTDVSWVCSNDKNENTQLRARTTTTTSTKVVSAITRDGKKQVTGFILQGFGGVLSSSTLTDGPAPNSCPSGPWALTTAAGDPVEISNIGKLQIRGVDAVQL